MFVFISCSGIRSRAVAEALRKWLPKIINAVKPFVFTEDLRAGGRWTLELAEKLEAAEFGIVCLTPANLHADWILFETGAMSKRLRSRVCPVLIDIESADVDRPLSDFLMVKTDATGMKNLVKSINEVLPEPISEQQIAEVVETLWPELERVLSNLPDEISSSPVREPRQLLEEILERVRSMDRLRGLTTSERHSLIQTRLANLISLKMNENVKSISAFSDGREIFLSYETTNGGTYGLTLPNDCSLDQAEALMAKALEQREGKQ